MTRNISYLSGHKYWIVEGAHNELFYSKGSADSNSGYPFTLKESKARLATIDEIKNFFGL